MTTKNTIITATIDNVLYCPIEAVHSNDSNTFVYLKDGRSIIKKQIIVSQSNENEIIVKTGVKLDDELYLNPPEKAEKLELVRLSKEDLEKYRLKPANPKKPK
jgi:HlyD family secretion protein